ncbi:MAG: ASKHA domain-containing protein, partial [Alphaproteobacteria bacterium]|nr:ASKHA domain-containing protein [Alphaproteobacteria bacterium]
MTSSVEVRIVDPDGGTPDGVATVSVGETLLDAAMAAGADISATCGRRGKCRSCRVKIVDGDMPPPTLQDRLQLGDEAVQEQFRLSCQTQVIAPCRIMVAPPRTETGHQILAGTGDAGVGNLDICSGVQKICIQAVAPMDENSQSTDLQEILNKLPDTTEVPTSLAVLRQMPSVLREDGGRLTVTTFDNRITHVEPGDTTEHMYGMAFDIGTTSVVGTLVDLISGEELAAVGNINPQAVHGGDLMSRIAFAQFDEKNLATLRGEILNAINGFVAEACERAGIAVDHVYKMVIVGNTCMHHIFLGIDTSYVGLAPYAPVLSGAVVLPSSELPLKRAPNAVVCLLPIIAGFVGADTTAAILATRIHESSETRCLVDIGTNGEVVMGSKSRLMACSAPAGPALEGGQIHQGMRAAIGAIEKVHIDDDIHLG